MRSKSADSWRERLTRRLQPDEVEVPDAEATEQLAELSRQWRRQIPSHVDGLRPHLDPERDHVRGAAAATVTLLEYGDFMAPSCREAAPVLRELGSRFGDELRFAYRHFPIADAHPLTLAVAVATEAASAQGEFWEMHDRILRSEFGTDPSALRRHARELKLDLDRYDEDIAGGRLVERVFEDFNSGTLSGVNGTPTFFINGARLDWDFRPEALRDAVENAMAVAAGPQ